MTRASQRNFIQAAPFPIIHGIHAYWYWMMDFPYYRGAWQPLESYVRDFNR